MNHLECTPNRKYVRSLENRPSQQSIAIACNDFVDINDNGKNSFQTTLLAFIFNADYVDARQQHTFFSAMTRHVPCEEIGHLHDRLREHDGLSLSEYKRVCCGRSNIPILDAIWRVVDQSLDGKLIPSRLERLKLMKVGLGDKAVDEVFGLIAFAQICKGLALATKP